MSARLLLIAGFGHPLPFADEWDAAAAGLYRPYVTGELTLSGLFAPFNEHRIVTSRLLGLVEFELAGGWNVLFQMAVNAAIVAGLATWLAALLSPLVPERRRVLLLAVTGLTFSLPIDHEVSLMGMNAHFYFLILFSIAGLLGLTRGRPLGPLWWSGLAWCALAYFSMASAALTPLVALCVVGLQAASGVRRIDGRQIMGAILLVAAAGLMFAYVPDIPGHERYRAQSAGQFITALTAIAALPLVTPFGVAFVHAPIVLHVWRTLRHRLQVADPAWIAIALAGWIAAQMISIAYSRAPFPTSSRYLDIVLLALPIGAAIVLSLPRPSRRLAAAGAVWLFVIGLMVPLEAAFVSLRMVRGHYATLEREQAVVTAFLATGDGADILAGAAPLSYPNPQTLIARLSDPTIRSLIPIAIQPEPAVPFDASRLLLRGGFRSAIGTGTSLIGPIGLGLGSLAVALWFVAGYFHSGRGRGEPEPDEPPKNNRASG